MKRPDTAVVEVRWLDHCSSKDSDFTNQDQDLVVRYSTGYLVGYSKSEGQDVVLVAMGWDEANAQWNELYTIMAPFKVRVLQRKGA